MGKDSDDPGTADLFDDPIDSARAYRGKTDTSRKAAEQILSVSGRQRRRVYEFIKARGNATLHEISLGLDITLQSVCARRKELEQMGFVEDAGFRRTSPSGRACIVWRLAP